MANIQVRVDDKLKAEADALFADIGLDTSTAIRVFLRQAVASNGIPFAIRREPNYETLNAIREARRGIGLSRGFTSVDELMEDLDADH